LRWADPTSSFLPPLCPPRCFSLSPYRSADLTLPCLDLLAAGICHLGHARSSSFILRVSRVHVGGGCGKFHASRLSHRATIRHAHASARRTRARAARDRGPAAPPRAARRWSRVQCASSPTWPQPISGADRVRDASLLREAGSAACAAPCLRPLPCKQRRTRFDLPPQGTLITAGRRGHPFLALLHGWEVSKCVYSVVD